MNLDSRLGRHTELAVFFNPVHYGSANFLRGLDEDKRESTISLYFKLKTNPSVGFFALNIGLAQTE